MNAGFTRLIRRCYLCTAIFLLFLVPADYWIAHCITRACGMWNLGPRGDPLKFQQWKQPVELVFLAVAAIPIAYVAFLSTEFAIKM